MDSISASAGLAEGGVAGLSAAGRGGEHSTGTLVGVAFAMLVLGAALGAYGLARLQGQRLSLRRGCKPRDTPTMQSVDTYRSSVSATSAADVVLEEAHKS